MHTSEGKFLVTRLVPCPCCLQQSSDLDSNFPNTPNDLTQNKNFLDAMNQVDAENDRHRIRKSQESYTSECDSGVGPDSTGSSRMPSMEGHPGVQTDDNANNNNQIYYSWMVEECILASYDPKCVACPTHGDVSLSRIAPDTVENCITYLKRTEFIRFRFLWIWVNAI